MSELYEKVSTTMNTVERERRVLDFWRRERVFETSIQERCGHPSYTFYDGPPTANGKPHIGHVLTRVIKDMIPRYRTMKGFMVPRKAGWDTHGLPVEIEVEKKLGLDGKEQIEAYGLEPFIRECKESVWKYKGMWEDFSGTVGYWADMDNPYVTYDNNFIESEWWALKEIWNKGLLYRGYKIVPYCPRCGTPLSAQEVAQGYKTVKERSAIVRFKVVGEEDTYILAWTTTPWTLPSNVALCVHPTEEYIRLRSNQDGKVYILASALADTHFPDGYETLATCAGKDLEYTAYEPLYEVPTEGKKCHYVVADTYVTMGDGTGVVHIAPGFGADDYRVGCAYDLPVVQMVDTAGNMKGDPKFAGLFVKKADPEVLKDLDARGLLFDAPKFEHEYPHCWRCDTPLIYYARDSWFIKMTAVRENLIRNNNTVNWIPDSIGKGRFGDWLANVQDWGISRNRYWGTPLNIWECSCGHRHCVGSIEELKSMSDNCPADIELHRPYIDAVTLRCPACGGEMKRVSEVIDCWFDSGSMPFAQHHYPFENADLFHAQFPADFISEAVDQTRGWFYSLMAISTLLFDCAPYRNVIVLGHVQDKNGQKMSKSKGNAVDPFEALEKYGADAIRWYFYSNSAPWLPNRFHEDAVMEGMRGFMGTIWNTYYFYVLYANIDGFDPTAYTLDYASLSVMDKWLLSKLNTLVKTVDDNLAAYKIPETARALESFVDELSNWYVRRSRERYWVSGMPQDKINAYMTLYTALVTLAKVAAPMLPFLSEEIYRNLVTRVDATAPISVHLCDYPTYHAEMVDAALEENMEQVLTIVNLGRSARNAAAVKTRQPLAEMFVKSDTPLDSFYTAIIAEELNVKAVTFTDSVRAFTSYTFKPQLKTLGPKYGKYLGDIRTVLSTIDGNAAMDELEANGHLNLTAADGTALILEKDDLMISSAKTEGYASAEDKGVTVVLSTTLTPALIEEGYIREVVSKIQTMRKEAGFEVTDHIRIATEGNDTIGALMERNASAICADTLANELMTHTTLPYVKEWNINGETVTLSVQKI